jgi:hypothetical protein
MIQSLLQNMVFYASQIIMKLTIKIKVTSLKSLIVFNLNNIKTNYVHYD